ncbi:actin cytoskeleton-regulatory complex protein pan-1 [Triticum aestivum]|uniref:actin cytoskeleton-regulatory complex protein pan-1 n=1 Tax=Triticum aestivum TaxID=4565 RepID=UPI001D0089D2|nr:actin cytoskeleton-regulatory complex protein pan-1-like [Triticum aestivum]
MHRTATAHRDDPSSPLRPGRGHSCTTRRSSSSAPALRHPNRGPSSAPAGHHGPCPTPPRPRPQLRSGRLPRPRPAPPQLRPGRLPWLRSAPPQLRPGRQQPASMALRNPVRSAMSSLHHWIPRRAHYPHSAPFEARMGSAPHRETRDLAATGLPMCPWSSPAMGVQLGRAA